MNNGKDISFFGGMWKYRKTVVRRYPHLLGGSSMIRGQQIADYLGAKFNPQSDYENDLQIHIKPLDLDHIKEGAWIDIVDQFRALPDKIKQRSDLKVIAVSECSRDIYWKPQFDNPIVVIPPHHCNFNRERRTRTVVDTVGYIGSKDAFHIDIERVKKIVESIGLNFTYNYHYRNREEVVEFYKNIDIQLVWSSQVFRFQSIGPTKGINAASFGIPTVAYPQVCYGEIEGKYIRASNLTKVMRELKRLRDNPNYYQDWVGKLDFAEDYHISKIAERYKAL